MLRRSHSLLPLLALLALLAGACGGGADEGPPPLRFSAIPDQDSRELAERYGLVARYLERELGVPVEYVPAADYTASVEAFRAGDIQLAWFGGLTHVRAREAVPGARAIAQGAIDPRFKSCFVVNAATGILPSERFPMALEGRSFTFGERSSTSGRLMPEYWIRAETGRGPEDFFGGAPQYASDHTHTAELVEAGTFEAGALNYKVYEAMVRDGRVDPEVCRKVWETPPYPDYNWTAHPALEERFGAGFTERLQAALVGIEDPALLAALQREGGMIPAQNSDYDLLERVATELGLLR